MKKKILAFIAACSTLLCACGAEETINTDLLINSTESVKEDMEPVIEMINEEEVKAAEEAARLVYFSDNYNLDYSFEGDERELQFFQADDVEHDFDYYNLFTCPVVCESIEKTEDGDNNIYNISVRFDLSNWEDRYESFYFSYQICDVNSGDTTYSSYEPINKVAHEASIELSSDCCTCLANVTVTVPSDYKDAVLILYNQNPAYIDDEPLNILDDVYFKFDYQAGTYLAFALD